MNDKQFVERVRIPSYLCAPDDRIGFDGVASLLQEAAWQHARRLGFAFTEENVTFYWVLYRLRMRFHQRPQWDDQVTVTTWPSGMERLYALREFHIDDERGNRMVDVSSAWIILDAARRRPARPQHHLPEDRIHDQHLLELPTGKTALIPEETVHAALEGATWHHVRPSDTDRNQHVNNARYAQWIQDGVPPHLRHPDDGTLTFTAETHQGQEYAVVYHAGTAEVWVREIGATLDTAVCACRYNGT